jgi:NTP pyrophosphatase (non-canonical NTP hydrolase)
MNIANIKEQLRDFAQDRDWEKYHNPKNLAMALTVEAGELQEIFQWLTPEESQEVKSNSEHAAEEIADVFLYLVRIADVLDVDIEKAVSMKLKKNAIKYPTNGPDTPRSLR